MIFQPLFRKMLNSFVMVALLVAVLAGVLPTSQAEAAGVANSVTLTVNNGWSKFSWSPAVRGAFTFRTTVTTMDPAFLTLPSSLTLVTTAKVQCPATGDARVNVKVYDFDKLILSTSYAINCGATTTDPTVIKSADTYLSDPHYFHASVALAAGGAHQIVVETDLPTSDGFFWAYARVDTAPTVPPTDKIDNGAIALTVVDPPAGAWVGVQWGDPTGTQWTNIDTWTNPLVQTPEGRVAYWIDAKDQGTGPYRWVVYDKNPAQGGQIWAVSDPFNFPRAAGDWVWSKVNRTSMTS